MWNVFSKTFRIIAAFKPLSDSSDKQNKIHKRLYGGHSGPLQTTTGTGKFAGRETGAAALWFMPLWFMPVHIEANVESDDFFDIQIGDSYLV